MSGVKAVDSFHEVGAPDSNFPETLWNTDPKTLALAFAQANRSPSHHKNFQLWVDSSPSLTAPTAGWLVLDDFSSQVVLRFGVDQPFLFQATSSSLFASNHFVDSEKHSLQFIPLSPDEARFLAHTAFWLEHLKSMPTQKNYGLSHFSSSHESYGTLEWQIDKQPRHGIQGILWDGWPISNRWRGDYDEEAQLNLTHFLLTETLPKHLGKRWEPPARITYDSSKLPLSERLKSQDDPTTQAQLTQVIHTALARHESDPWPAKALVALADCAGDAGLNATLPALEALAAKLPSPSADETEFTALDAQFRHIYPAPMNPAERKKWDRHQSLQTALEHDFLTQVRQPLNRCIRQLHANGQPALLREMAQSNDDAAMWALRQLYRLQADAYAEVLIHRFATEKVWSRRHTFETLTTLNPVAARRLRDSFTEKEQADLLFEIIKFDLIHDPSRAQSRIPELLDIVEKPTGKISGPGGYPVASKRGPAIALLAKLPLNPADQHRFEGLLIKELLIPETHETYGKIAITSAANAIIARPNPDRFWDTLYQATSVETGSSEFNSLLNALATLAIAKPEPRLSHLAELLRHRLRNRHFQIDALSKAALALDLRCLMPEIGNFATSGPSVADGEVTNSCKDDPDKPCMHRYHSARHVSALWQEPDADTRARMWTEFMLRSPYDFAGTSTIPACLRDRCSTAIAAASPEIRKQLVAKARSNIELPREILDWLAGFP
ncbi:MAG TPA: hypothetical protein VF258_09415 [Luteolibacter sp.]